MGDNPEPYVFDVQALLAWASASGNESQSVFESVSNGRVLIYNRVWNDFLKAFPDEAAFLIQTFSFSRVRVKDTHRMSAAALVAKADGVFMPRGPYDDCTELCVSGIAACDGCTVLTDQRRKARYEKIDGLTVLTFDEFLEEH